MSENIEDLLREITIESKRISKELERLWNRYYDIKVGLLSNSHISCDSCEDKENKDGI